jgi:ribonuclease HI
VVSSLAYPNLLENKMLGCCWHSPLIMPRCLLCSTLSLKIANLREGLGIVTNNAAEYRALILGLKYAAKKGFKHIRAQGDSKLVCYQVSGIDSLVNLVSSCWSSLGRTSLAAGISSNVQLFLNENNMFGFLEQVQDLWRVKSNNLSDLCKKAKCWRIVIVLVIGVVGSPPS